MIVDVGLNSKLLHQGCFETMLGINGSIPLIHHHFSRLQRGLDLLNWRRPEDLSIDTVTEWFKNELDSQNETHWRIRLGVESDADSLKWSLTKEAVQHPTSPFNVKTIRLTDHHNTVHEQLCKLSDRIIYKSALSLAHKEGADDAILINKDGFVSESCIAGILIVKNNRFMTPDVQSGGLRGVGLEVLKPLLISNLMTVKEYPLELETLFNADCVWLVNALRGPFPIKTIDGKPVNFHPDIHQKIYDLFWSRIHDLVSEEED